MAWALGCAGLARAAPAVAPGAAEGSVARLAARLGAALEERARSEGVAGPVRIEVAPARGIDVARVERAFLPRLKRRLHEGGVLVPAAAAPVLCRVVVSEERSAFWAVATLEGGALVGPSTVAVSAEVDRELEAALGAVARPAQSRFVLERLGAVPAGVLDAMLADSDRDGMDELVLLGVDGLRVLRVGASRLEPDSALQPLPGARRWPRVPAGWLASLDDARVWGATSAGHAFVFDLQRQRFGAAPAGVVPLRGAAWGASAYGATGRAGSPVLSLPLVSSSGVAVRAPGAPPRVRDLAATPDGAWIYVTEQGELMGHRAGAQPASLAPERVGDRVLVVDFEGDGELELITTSALMPGEGDHVAVRRLARDVSTSSVAFRSPLSGGSVVALAAGNVDPGGRTDLVVIEALGAEALAWRVRFAP